MTQLIIAEREIYLYSASASEAGSPMDGQIIEFMHAIERGEAATTTLAESSTTQDATDPEGRAEDEQGGKDEVKGGVIACDARNDETTSRNYTSYHTVL
jgi:hypothetical protein